ncbi:protein dead ringer isoform X1 [Vespula maculifrons]|uniref:Protein dead ringer isoform X1 n=1 Tax=Vespula maculifrons TaxID=7453 RepID=A0ABD2CSK4_VESMC
MRVKKVPLPLCAMEMCDDYQDDDNPIDNFVVDCKSPKEDQEPIFNKQHRSITFSERMNQGSICTTSNQESSYDRRIEPMEDQAIINQRFMPIYDHPRFPIKSPIMGNQRSKRNKRHRFPSNQRLTTTGTHEFPSDQRSIIPIENEGSTSSENEGSTSSENERSTLRAKEGSARTRNRNFAIIRDKESPRNHVSFEIGDQRSMHSKNEECILRKKQESSSQSEESLSPRSQDSESITENDKTSSIPYNHRRVIPVSKQLMILRQMCKQKNDPARNEFLTHLCNFMARRGQPIFRMPTIAKSTLDLYDLYREVVHRGGLVEVINQNHWQEIIKNINLPTKVISIGSKLRVLYIRYLYDYECEYLNLSNKIQLFEAIESIRRKSNSTDKKENQSKSLNTEEERRQTLSSELIETSELKETQASTWHEPKQLKFNDLPCHSQHLNQEPNSSLMLPNLMSSNSDSRVIEHLPILNKESNKNNMAKVSSLETLSSSMNPSKNHQQSVTISSKETNTDFNEHQRLNFIKPNNKNSDNLPTHSGSSTKPSLQTPSLQTPSKFPSKSILNVRFDPKKETKSLNLKSSRGSLLSTNSDIPIVIDINKDDEQTSPLKKRHLDNSSATVERNLITSTPTCINIQCRNQKKETIYVCLELQGITYQGILYATNNLTLTTSVNNENDTTPQKLTE